MTAREFKRARKWDTKVAPAYQSGCADGWDAFGEGRSCPEPLLSDYDTTFYVRRRMRWIQGVSNATIARSRERYDGWSAAADKYHATLLNSLQGGDIVSGFESLLKKAA